MKQFAGTLATLVLLGGLAGYYFFIDVPREEKKIKETRESARVLPYLLDKVHRLTYKNGELTVVAEKEKLTWKLKKPLETLGDHMLLNGMLQQLEEARHTRVVEENPEDLSQFGLKDPAISITLEEKSFGKKTVHIGSPSPIGHSAYFKVDDNPRVILVPGFQKDWAKTLFEFRSKTLLDFPTEKITQVTLERPGGTLSIKKEKDEWHISRPIEALGDKAAIENLINQIRHARAQAFVEETPSDLTIYKLDKPKHLARFSDEENSWGLDLGTAQGENTFHAKLKNKSNVVAVENRVKAAIETNYLDLIDKRVLTFKEDEIVQIQITSEEGENNRTVVINKEEGEKPVWKITHPTQVDADQAAVNSLLFDLKDTRAIAFMTFGNKENFGLENPKQSLTIKKKNGDTETLHLGNANLDGKQYFLSRSLDGGVFVLETEKVNKLFRAFKDLRDRSLVSIDSDQVHHIVLKYPDKTFELKRAGKNWTLLKPEKVDPLKPFIGNDILWTVNSLQFEQEFPSTGSEKTGFDSPTLTLSLSDENGSKLATVIVGNAVEDTKLRWAKTEDPTRKVHIQDRFLNEIPKTLEKFQLAQEQ
ncbi:MAG: DUF4340 domain-containing protein [Candidatus Nitronauta litoralis]|uniref:DUF4340 domain-containing protein n=1 Tax=Candidatus Nitronauta litoralis TaxID=2705533 RepID=A0A7T0G019_9BACT|nr:MAG: DUF4340 domain-containing protein [Candidatus Nitronauta litoralis]